MVRPTPEINRVKALPPTNKILLVLPFWEHDKPQAMKLARLLADLEPGHSSQADLLFVSRFDCTHDTSTVREVSRKFNVYTHTSKRRGTGWPMGCNSLFFGSLEWVYHKIAAGQVPHYKSILMLAADGAPLQKDWLVPFRSASAFQKDVFVSGALIYDSVNGHDHINGDCMLLSGDLEFLRWLAITVGDVSVTAGWDWILSEEFKRWGWQDLSFVRSVWNKRTEFTSQEWDEAILGGVVWYHGQKGNSLLELSRKKLL